MYCEDLIDGDVTDDLKCLHEVLKDNLFHPKIPFVAATKFCCAENRWFRSIPHQCSELQKENMDRPEHICRLVFW